MMGAGAHVITRDQCMEGVPEMIPTRLQVEAPFSDGTSWYLHKPGSADPKERDMKRLCPLPPGPPAPHWRMPGAHSAIACDGAPMDLERG